MNNSEVFLIDANALITPKLSFYPFDLAPSFWKQMGTHIANGSVVILDLVKSEILQGNDELTEWMKNLSIGTLVDRRDEKILQNYSAVLQHLQENPCYKPSALKEWARATVADPWLIAAAEVYNYTIITFETHIVGLNDRTPSRIAKIPDVADVFGVKTANLYYLMRTLGFYL